MHISTVKNKDNSYEIYFEELDSWDEFDLILKKIVSENDCRIVKEIDMITDKDVVLKLGKIPFILRNHYMFGNYIYSTKGKHIKALEELAQNVIESIKLDFENK